MSRKKPKARKFLQAIHNTMDGLYTTLCGFVFHSFKGINRKIKSKLPAWRMEEETLEHVRSAIKVFKWIVLPASLLYPLATFIFLGENALGSTLWGILFFFYSNFLPDLPSICRKKKNNVDVKDLPWYKKYAILLFAPLFIWLLFSGTQLTWKTTETFHNFKSLTVYGAFLLLLSFFAYANFPFQIGNMTGILSIPFYGIIGYLTHLRVDKIW